MEAGELRVRQSGITTANSLEHLDRRPRDQRIETSYSPAPAMATALVSPSGPYHHQHHNSFSAGYPHSAPPSSGVPGMISPVEPRRPSDDSSDHARAHAHRQSLPSISEVIGNVKSSFGTPSAAPIPPPPSLPSPFSSAPSRPLGNVGAPDKTQSPRTLLPTSTSFPRPDPLPAFSDPARSALPTRPIPPPLNTYPSQQPSPPVKLEHAEVDQRHPEQQPPLSATIRQPPPPPPPPQPITGLYGETGRLPPGQLPLSAAPAYPLSPRHSGPPLTSPYETQRPASYHEGVTDSQNARPADYKSALDKHFATWGYEEALRQVASSCRTGYHFAEAYIAAAREQQGSHPIPSRMPTENEVTSLLNNFMLALKKLEEIRDMIQQNRLQTDRSREGGSKEGEDVSMYGEAVKQTYPPVTTEVKKRRGRAAPPGRCHSCNRIDTPEWRRGPDGARTLCNACGLHYAKLERKRQLDSRSALRPKPADGAAK